MSHTMGPRIQTHPNPYDDFDVEIEVWCARPRRWIIPARWEGSLDLRPRAPGGWIPLRIGNEYTGLLYAWSRKRVVAKAERIVAQERRRIARRTTSEMVAR